MTLELVGWSNYYIENAEKEFTPIQRKNIDNTFKKILSPSTERAIERASKKAEKIAEKYAKKY